MYLKNCNAIEFAKCVRNKKLVCFGAGSMMLETAYEVHIIPGLEQMVDCFVDNDPQKWGKKIILKGTEFSIHSPELLQGAKQGGWVILITCMAYQEVIGQLQKVIELEQTDVYLYNCVVNMPTLDVEHFFTKEICKPAYVNYREILQSMRLKDKYKGRRCFIIGNGPSLTADDLTLLKDEITFACNRIFLMFSKTEWRPTYYFCIDYLICGMDTTEMQNISCDGKFIPSACALAQGGVYDSFTYYNRSYNYSHIKDGVVARLSKVDFSRDILDVTYGGQTVSYDMLQFAYYMGFDEVYLIGMDHKFAKEVSADGSITSHEITADHFSEEYDKELKQNVAVVSTLYMTTAAFEAAKTAFDQDGRTVYNATRGGYLEVFERACLDDILCKKEQIFCEV